MLPAGLVRPRVVVVAGKNDEPLSRFYQPIHCNDLVLREYEGLGHLHGGVCWTAGHVLALTLHRHYHHVVNKSTVVELGSGCGAAGLTCAKLGAFRVVLTDKHREILQGLRASALANELRTVKCAYLSWSGDLPREVADEAVDLVVAADALYSLPGTGAFLAACLAIAKKSPKVKILVCIEERWSTLECVDVIKLQDWTVKEVFTVHAEDLRRANESLKRSQHHVLDLRKSGDAKFRLYELTAPPQLVKRALDAEKKAATGLRTDSFINKRQ